jgi:predicted metal-dependent hydrolase
VLGWAEKLGVKGRSLAVRKMRNKWASCSTAGNLNFNAELISLSKKIGDYVIVHELLHFSIPNHGRLWKSLMRAHLGDYERLEAQLNKVTSKRFD